MPNDDDDDDGRIPGLPDQTYPSASAAPCGRVEMELPPIDELVKKLQVAFGPELCGAVLLFTKPCSADPKNVHYVVGEVVMVPTRIQSEQKALFSAWIRQTMGEETLDHLEEDQRRIQQVKTMFVQPKPAGRQ